MPSPPVLDIRGRLLRGLLLRSGVAAALGRTQRWLKVCASTATELPDQYRCIAVASVLCIPALGPDRKVDVHGGK